MNEILKFNRAEKLLLFDIISQKLYSKKDSWESIISKKIFEEEYRSKSSKEIQKIKDIVENNNLINKEVFEILLTSLVKN